MWCRFARFYYSEFNSFSKIDMKRLILKTFQTNFFYLLNGFEKNRKINRET